MQESRDVFEVIATRRSTKRFAPRPVEMDKILQVIQAGSLAPSSGNIQNWTFTVITDVDRIRDLYQHTLNQEAFLSAPAAVIVCGDVEYAHTMYGMRGKRLYTIQNCAAAIENMLLAANALGLGAIWIGAFDEDKVADMFGIPNHQHRPQAIILFGYPDPDVPIDDKETKPLDALIFFNKFGNKVQRPHLIFFDWAAEWRLQAQKAKGHFQHAVRKVKPAEPVSESPAQTNAERRQSSFDLAKKRIRSTIDRLKKEQYREK